MPIISILTVKFFKGPSQRKSLEIALVQLQGTSYYKKKNNFALFCPDKAWETFKIFSRTFQKQQLKFKNFPGQEKKLPRLFQNVTTLSDNNG